MKGDKYILIEAFDKDGFLVDRAFRLDESMHLVVRNKEYVVGKLSDRIIRHVINVVDSYSKWKSVTCVKVRNFKGEWLCITDPSLHEINQPAYYTVINSFLHDNRPAYKAAVRSIIKDRNCRSPQKDIPHFKYDQTKQSNKCAEKYFPVINVHITISTSKMMKSLHMEDWT